MIVGRKGLETDFTFDALLLFLSIFRHFHGIFVIMRPYEKGPIQWIFFVNRRDVSIRCTIYDGSDLDVERGRMFFCLSIF